MRATRSIALQSEINVTPLVDVCLVLLIIFMVVTPVIVNGVQVHLPPAATADPLARQPLLVTINADGVIYVGGPCCAATSSRTSCNGFARRQIALSSCAPRRRFRTAKS